jgi:hypothetical protein
MQYQGSGFIYGYYGSHKLNHDIFNYSYWSTDLASYYRYSGMQFYKDNYCDRPYKGSCKKSKNCQTCQQLDIIQEQIIKHDEYVALIIQNPKLRLENSVYVRTPKPILYFKFNYNHLKS